VGSVRPDFSIDRVVALHFHLMWVSERGRVHCCCFEFELVSVDFRCPTAVSVVVKPASSPSILLNYLIVKLLLLLRVLLHRIECLHLVLVLDFPLLGRQQETLIILRRLSLIQQMLLGPWLRLHGTVGLFEIELRVIRRTINRIAYHLRIVRVVDLHVERPDNIAWDLHGLRFLERWTH
jgi:hypothetical protein